MKIRVEIDPEISENELVIRCNQIDESVTAIQNILLNSDSRKKKIVFFKDETEFYLAADEVLFYETSDNMVWAHTKEDEFQVKYKLYELERMMPEYFVRVSKSTILNTKKVYCIQKNLAAASRVEFYDSHKIVYVSRSYYKGLKEKLSLGIGE